MQTHIRGTCEIKIYRMLTGTTRKNRIYPLFLIKNPGDILKYSVIFCVKLTILCFFEISYSIVTYNFILFLLTVASLCRIITKRADALCLFSGVTAFNVNATRGIMANGNA